MQEKLCIIHDWLMGMAGSERVLEAILELYPSPIYTLIHDKRKLKGTPFESCDIRASFIERLPFAKRFFRHYLPLFPLAIERLDIHQYPLIISSSHAVAKGVRKRQGQLHVCYCHTPMRYAWDLKKEYLSTLGWSKQLIARPTLAYLCKWDLKTESGVDHFIANSHFVAERIKRIYGRASHVIYPPVNTHLFYADPNKEEYFMTCSRLVPYKRVDLIVQAFAKMPRRRLLVVGDGPEMQKLRALASSNIELLGHLSDNEIRSMLAKARGFIFAAEEDFGIAPVEAQAAGTPVIAYGKGGSLETVLEEETGLFFQEQTVSSLCEAVERFDRTRFMTQKIQKHAENFSKSRFQHEFKNFISTRI